MADVKKTLDDMQKKLDEERREAEVLDVEIAAETEATKPPVYKPDHASDGGVI